MRAKVVIESLTACAGCEVAILDQGENLLKILEKIDLLHAPILMDHKYRDPENSDAIDIPEADIGIISGCIRNEENMKVARAVREKCKLVIANGMCACSGGITSMGNVLMPKDLKEGIYPDEETATVPLFTNRVFALNEVIEVDYLLPGCPPPTDMFADVLAAALEGKPYEGPSDTVCNECPRIKQKRTVSAEEGAAFPTMLRPLEKAPLDDRCLIEQGYFCMGAATKSGCGARCIKAGLPCRGCMGPQRIGDNPRQEMLGALSFYDYVLRDVNDRRVAFNWFTGAHNNLRPLPR